MKSLPELIALAEEVAQQRITSTTLADIEHSSATKHVCVDDRTKILGILHIRISTRPTAIGHRAACQSPAVSYELQAAQSPQRRTRTHSCDIRNTRSRTPHALRSAHDRQLQQRRIPSTAPLYNEHSSLEHRI